MSDRIKQLHALLADTFAIYVKTQNYHWNVEGPHFYALHKFFEEQYEALAEAVDEIAERIRALGSKVKASLKSYDETCSLSVTNEEFSSKEMLKNLHDDHTKIIKMIYDLFPVFEGDESTTDFLIERLTWHEQQAWMIGSHLK